MRLLGQTGCIWDKVWYCSLVATNCIQLLHPSAWRELGGLGGLRVYLGYWHNVTCWHHNNCFLCGWKEETERTNANRQCKHKKKWIFMNNLIQQKQKNGEKLLFSVIKFLRSLNAAGGSRVVKLESIIDKVWGLKHTKKSWFRTDGEPS